MAGRIEKRLKDLGVTLPEPMAPVASYVPSVRSGGLLFVSGQGPVWNGEIRHCGKVPDEVGLEEAVAAARLTGLNLLAQAQAALAGDLDRVVRVVKLGGFVNSVPDFTGQPQVIDGASELMIDVFGEAGRYALFAVGVPALPFDTSVEIDAVFEVV